MVVLSISKNSTTIGYKHVLSLVVRVRLICFFNKKDVWVVHFQFDALRAAYRPSSEQSTPLIPLVGNKVSCNKADFSCALNKTWSLKLLNKPKNNTEFWNQKCGVEMHAMNGRSRMHTADTCTCIHTCNCFLIKMWELKLTEWLKFDCKIYLT